MIDVDNQYTCQRKKPNIFTWRDIWQRGKRYVQVDSIRYISWLRCTVEACCCLHCFARKRSLVPAERLAFSAARWCLSCSPFLPWPRAPDGTWRAPWPARFWSRWKAKWSSAKLVPGDSCWCCRDSSCGPPCLLLNSSVMPPQFSSARFIPQEKEHSIWSSMVLPSRSPSRGVHLGNWSKSRSRGEERVSRCGPGLTEYEEHTIIEKKISASLYITMFLILQLNERWS